jgi:hypothetical protein
MKIFVDGNVMDISAHSCIAEGGEATIHELLDGRLLKLWKQPDHPDFAHDADMRAAAVQRIHDYGNKLLALPSDLAQRAPQLVVPLSLVRSSITSANAQSPIVGFAMRRIAGELLHTFGEPRSWQQHGFDGEQRVKILRSLHNAVTSAHDAGIVLGDFNDLNVMVGGHATAATVAILDVDSCQFARWPATMFTERFVDPRLVTRSPQGLAMVGQHDRSSDWFAYCAMVIKLLLGTSPWGGVWSPRDPTKRCTPSERVVRRISIFTPEIIYPRAARSIATLPTEVIDHLAAILSGTITGSFPRRLLDLLPYTTCAACKLVHARTTCPCGAAKQPSRASAQRNNDLQIIAIDPRSMPLGAQRIDNHTTASCQLWLRNGGIWRTRGLREERIASFVGGGNAMMWATQGVGCGFYRAGGLTIALWFRSSSGLANEFTGLPALPGQFVDAHAMITDDVSWISLTTAHGGKLWGHLFALTSEGIAGYAEISGQPWATGIAGACGNGRNLYVPTDDGVVRVGIVPGIGAIGAFAVERTFCQTATLVTAASRLAIDQRGLLTVSEHGAFALCLR